MALLIVINYIFFGIKSKKFFVKHDFSYYGVCNFLGCSLAELSVFLSPICLDFLFIRILNKVINEHTDCYLKDDDTLLKITIR